MAKTYRGRRLNPEEKTVSEVEVVVATDKAVRQLDPRPSQKFHNHSPTGFNWGYGGSGPAQLAIGILLDHFQDQGRVSMYYQRFKSAFVAGWGDEWEVTSGEIDAWVESVAKQDAMVPTGRIR